LASFGLGLFVMVTNWLLLRVIVRRWLGAVTIPPFVVDEASAQCRAGDEVVEAFSQGRELAPPEVEAATAESLDMLEDEIPRRDRRSAVRFFSWLLVPLKIAYVGGVAYVVVGVLLLPALWFVAGAVAGLIVVTTFMLLRRRAGG
jgi:hypothetical protein